jgi:PGF-CTERM protein
MSEKKNRWLKGAILVVAVAIVASSAALMVSGAGHVTTEQTADDTAVGAGETVNLTITLDTPSDFNSPAVDVDLPENWSVVSQSSSGTYRPSEIQWIWLSGGEKTVDYTVEIPENASGGTYQIVANGSAINGSTSETVADETVTEITVGSPEFEVSNLEAPASAVQGETITVNATVSNVGGVAGTTDAEFVFAGGALLDQTVSIDAGSSTQVSFDVPLDNISAGTYEHGVRAGDSFRTANITVQEPAEFEVSDLSAPASAVQGETITVNATVSNVGDIQGSTTAEFVFDGDVLLNQSVELGPGNATDVSFNVPTGEVPPGTYEHGVQAGDSIRTANITIQQPAIFEVSNLQAPASAVVGDIITVNATVSNVGGVADTTDAEFVFAGSALLNETVSLDAGNSTQVSFDVPTAGIASGTYEHGVRAGSGSQFADITIEIVDEFQTVLDGRDEGQPDADRDQYDVDLSQFLGANTAELKFEDFDKSDGLGPQLFGVVIRADGEVIHTIDANSDGEAQYLVADNGSQTQAFGEDTVRFADGDASFIYQFAVPEDAGNLTATIDVNNEFLVSARAAETPEFQVSNLEAPASAVSNQTITVNATISNVGQAQGVTDAEFVFGGEVLRNQPVSLGAGNSTPVSFDVSLSDVPSGTYEHGVQAGDDIATASLTVESLTTFEVTNLSAPATAAAGETITVNATISNVGNATDTIDANFLFAGDALLTRSVSLGAGNSTPVSFEVPTEGVAPGTYEHGIGVGNSSQFANITLEVPTEFRTILDGREDPDGPKEIDLSQFVAGDTVQIRFADWDTSDGLGAQLVNLDIRVDGESIATLGPGVGDDAEFVVDESDSNPSQSSNIRFADANAFFTYGFVVPEDAENLTATIDVNNEFLVDARSATGNFEVSNLSAPAIATGGDTITVNATVSNVGTADDSEATNAEFVFGGNVLLSQRVSLDAGDSTQVSFEVPTGGVAPGTYEHGVQAGNGSGFANITIQQPATFEVSGLSAPASAVQGETITVNATVSNVGDVQGSTTAEFVLAGGALLTENVTLDAGNSTQVSFGVPLENISAGTYEHGVRAGDSFPTANLTVQPPPAEFEVSNLDAPANATAGETITVNATVSNVGGTAGTTDVEFVFAGSALLTENVTLDAGNSTQVSFEVSTAGIAGGDYTHGIRAGDSFQTAQIDINEPPTVSVSATPESPEVNQTVTLNATDSTDGDGAITSYEWDLDGDGQYDDATGPTVDVEYSTSGEQTIGLRVTDDDGLTSETSVTVDVREGSDTISADQPGFGVGVALLALLVVALMIRRFD